MTAEAFVRKLAQTNALPYDVIDGLLERIAGAKNPISAELFAERLIERDVISRVLAEHIFNEHSKAEEPERKMKPIEDDKPNSAPLTKKPVSFIKQPIPNPIEDDKPVPAMPAKKPVSFSKQPMTKPLAQISTASSSSPVENTESPQRRVSPEQPSMPTPRFRKKVQQTDIWSSNRALFVGGSLFVLIFAASILFFSILHRSANDVLAEAERAYSGGSYPEAMKTYEEFTKRFPAHKDISKATVRHSLSKMLHAFSSAAASPAANKGSEPDWSRVFSVIKEETEAISGEAEFRSEAVPELISMLPKLADGLAKSAAIKLSDSNAVPLIEKTDETLLLVQKHLPDSEQQSELLQNVKNSIAASRRILARDEQLRKTRDAVADILKRNPFSQEDVKAAYAVLDDLILAYPILRNSEDARQIEQKISESEATTWSAGILPASGNAGILPASESELQHSQGLDSSLFTHDINEKIESLENETISVPFEGKIYTLKASDGTLIDGKPLSPKKTPVVYDGKILQLGERSTLFLIGESVQSVFVGHRKGSVRVPPIVFGQLILIIEQTDVRTSMLNVFAWKDDKTLVKLQSFELDGIVDTSPVADKKQIFVATDSGSLYQFLATRANEPLSLKLNAKGNAETARTIRYLLLADGQIWMADQLLTRFDVLTSQGRFTHKSAVYAGGATIAPLQKIGQTIFQVSAAPLMCGVTIRAVSADDLRVHWETHIGDPVFAEPILQEDGSNRVFTASGKVFVIDKNGQSHLYRRLPPNFLKAPIQRVLQLSDGYQLLIASGEPRTLFEVPIQIAVLDPDDNNRVGFRWLSFPAPVAAEPIFFGGGVLVPLQNGQIVLKNPRTNEDIAYPFVAEQIQGENKVSFSSPISVDENTFFIIEKRDRNEESNLLHKIALDKTEKPFLKRLKSVLIPERVTKQPYIQGDDLMLPSEDSTYRYTGERILPM